MLGHNERGHVYNRMCLLTGNSTFYNLPITTIWPDDLVSVVVVSGANNTKTPDFKIV